MNTKIYPSGYIQTLVQKEKKRSESERTLKAIPKSSQRLAHWDLTTPLLARVLSEQATEEVRSVARAAMMECLYKAQKNSEVENEEAFALDLFMQMISDVLYKIDQ